MSYMCVYVRLIHRMPTKIRILDAKGGGVVDSGAANTPG